MHRPTAEYRFLEARRIVRKETEKRRMDHMQFFQAQASFYLAELAHLEFSEFHLKWPTEKDVLKQTAKLTAAGGTGDDANKALGDLLGSQLEEKCQRLLRAQYQYLRAIREGHAGWASASGYNVGHMYEEMHEEMVALPAPNDLTVEQKELYVQMVRKKVLILLEKAEKTYSQTADMVTRTGSDGEWGDKTRKSLENVRRRLLEESAAVADVDSAPSVPLADTGKGKGKT